jgi:hypothetical protein
VRVTSTSSRDRRPCFRVIFLNSVAFQRLAKRVVDLITTVSTGAAVSGGGEGEFGEKSGRSNVATRFSLIVRNRSEKKTVVIPVGEAFVDVDRPLVPAVP